MKRFLLLCVFSLFGVAQSKAGCPLINVSLQDRISQSELVVEGKVINKSSYWDESIKMIYTSHTLQVYRLFKGKLNNQTITLITEGGFVGLQGLVVSPNLSTEIGQTGVFFLSANNQWENPQGISLSYFSPIGPLGFIYYDYKNVMAYDNLNHWGEISSALIPEIIKITGIPEVISESPTPSKQGIRRATPSITSFSPGTVHAGTQEVITVNGTDFGATQGNGNVYFPNANDGGGTYIPARSGDIVSWSDTKIELKVPSSAGTGKIYVEDNSSNSSAYSSSTLSIPWAHLNVQYPNYPPSLVSAPFEIRHQSLNGSGGITWTWETDFNSNSDAKASFLRALETWRCKTLINWSVSGVKTNASNSYDGDNMVFYNDALPGSVIGVCYSWYSGCFKSGGSGDMNWFVSELDIAFKKTFSWEYGPTAPSMSEYDFESVALHELGHGHQLGHVINSANVMHYAISNGDNHRALQENDTACGNYVMKKSTSAVCAGTGMTLVKQVECMVRDPLIFRSKKSGRWNDLATWEYGPWDGSYWHDTIILPSFYIDSVIIRNSHTVEITDDRVITRTTIQSGGILKWSSGNLFMDNGINRNLIIENGGTFYQANDSIAERQGLSNIKMDSEGILISKNKDGLLGIGSVYFVSPFQQTFIFNKTGVQNAGSSLPSSCQRFFVDSGSILTLQKDISISDTLKLLDGIIKTSSYILSLGTSTTDKGTLGYTTGYIDGALTRWFDGTNSGSASGLFPLGNNGNQKFVTVEFTSAPTTGGTLSASYISTSMGSSGLPIAVSAVGSCSGYNISNTADAYWKIDDGNSLSGGTYSISTEAEGFAGITDLCELGLLKRSGMGSWGLAGTSVQTGGTLLKPIVKVTGASGWSNFGWGGGAPNPLPIQLSEFTAVKDLVHNRVNLYWTTVSETNNAYFEVQRSTDGLNWEVIETVSGQGNTDREVNYISIDNKPNQGINYYRLRQVDYDGKSSFSHIQMVLFDSKSSIGQIKLYPNSTSGLINITNPSYTKITLILMSLEGKTMFTKEISESHGSIDISNITAGIYIVKIISGDFVEYRKVVKE